MHNKLGGFFVQVNEAYSRTNSRAMTMEPPPLYNTQGESGPSQPSDLVQFSHQRRGPGRQWRPACLSLCAAGGWEIGGLGWELSAFPLHASHPPLQSDFIPTNVALIRSPSRRGEQKRGELGGGEIEMEARTGWVGARWMRWAGGGEWGFVVSRWELTAGIRVV